MAQAVVLLDDGTPYVTETVNNLVTADRGAVFVDAIPVVPPATRRRNTIMIL